MAERAAEFSEPPELPLVIFYAMLLNEAEKLGVLHGLRLRALEVALIESRWGEFESWIWMFGDRVYEAQFRPKSGSGEGARAEHQGESSSERATADDAASEGVASPELGKQLVLVYTVSMAFSPIGNTREMAHYVRETFIWRWRSASRPPCPFSEDFHVLCPCFSLAEAEAAAAEAAAAEFDLSEIVQATFYAMLLNKTLELGVAHEYTAKSMKSSLVGLRWSAFEVWMHIMNEVIRGAQLYHPPDEVDVEGARDG
ncbi:hypothetical protein Cgig2_013792 [Carnegiea gigantea]|uniref:Uncharacterized protein n=1 Tax=Carnegiea gigantea TaxID=171969 RepID=A0A9Q1Q613_9CARY|nr:hypothetical protein Cgig2_013792 [Carnegiea gigantea]